ncbi:MAG: hypothetical protein J2P13_09005, partial [Acidobacteria bacterium]|nr:hypothetical protein [Acidobacteriota bacterium]
RVEDLLKLGMNVEAKALVELVIAQYPGSRSRIAHLGWEITARSGSLDEVVAPLADPTLASEHRQRIETFIRQRVDDLAALAEVSSLPPEHPLRSAAKALAAAFTAVTEGPVEDQALALPEVSRRSPLAPWKALIHSMASFYRREDSLSRKWLEQVPTDSVPARLVRPIAVMMGADSGCGLRAPEQRLIAAVGGGRAVLGPALRAFEKALGEDKRKPLLEAASTAVALCGKYCPAIQERLRQHIVERALAFGVGRQEICSKVGTPREDAYLWRLLARSAETSPSPGMRAEAIVYWETFRSSAIAEKWFAPGGAEDGVLSLHMARIADRLPLDVLDMVGGAAECIRSRRPRSPGELEGRDLLSPEKLYARACRTDPHPDAFQMWLNWSRKHRNWKAADEVAELWGEYLPEDTRPLLYLMKSAEERRAYRKALKYLEAAEELDRLNPEVRYAKLRLLLSSALRNLQQGKTRLVKTGIGLIAAHPEVREGETAALATALSLLCAVVEDDKASIERQCEELKVRLGSAVSAFVLAHGLAKAARLDEKLDLASLRISPAPTIELLPAVTRVALLGDSAGVALELDRDFEGPLIAGLRQPDHRPDASAMMALGEMALRSGLKRLAYAVSTEGLEGGAADAQFLLLRGQAIPPGQPERQQGCLLAALELARRERNLELAGRIFDIRARTDGADWDFDRLGGLESSRSALAELVNEILAEEKKEKGYPAPGRLPRYASKLESPPCSCPECRAWRGEAGKDDDEEWFPVDDEEELIGDFLDQFASLLGPITPQMKEEFVKLMATSKSPEQAASRFFKKFLPEKMPSPVEKRAKPPVPEQGTLF